jgi:hypothetical protein
MKLIFACAIVLSLVAVLQAQEPSSAVSGQGTTSLEPASLPDAPGTGSVAATEKLSSSNSPGPEQTKRILGFIPNFRSVSADVILPPQTTKEKFTIGLQDTFDYSNLIFVGAQAGLSQATNSYPAFHQGARGYGRYYWHTFADQSDENLLVESVLPAAFHEDSRYYTLGHGGVIKRAAYAMSRALITRSDSGTEVFNAAEIIGAGGAQESPLHTTPANIARGRRPVSAGSQTSSWTPQTLLLGSSGLTSIMPSDTTGTNGRAVV